MSGCDHIVLLENSRFNEAIRHNAGGSTFLGYLYTEVVVPGALPDGEDLKIGMPDLQVRITVDGKPRIDFPEDEREVRGDTRRVARYFSANRETREELTKLVFAIPAVSRAVEKAERSRAAA